MTLYELITDMAKSELSNLQLAENGVIKEESIPTVIGLINEAMLRLHTRFILSQKQLILKTVTHITNYHLTRKFAESNTESTEPYKYILDLTGEPFKDDVIRVFEVYTEEGNPLPLNDRTCAYSLYTPVSNIIQVPNPDVSNSLTVIYQAKAEKITEDLMEEDLDIPWFLLSAVRAYVAYKIFTNMVTQESSIKAQEHLKLFEGICMEAVSTGLVLTGEPNINCKFTVRGFV